jgi:NAD(P)-dependent dehydrogenase (short-subunit alcohol dehydrogenase family)
MGVRDLRGKRCLITGAASGIGRATALLAASRGAELFLTDIDAEGLEKVAEEVRGAAGTVSYAKAADIADYEAIVAMAEEIHATGVNMDVVMNIAGVSAWGSIDRLERRHWQKMVDINLMGPVGVLECFVPPMIAAKQGGHIVNVSSAAGLFGLPWHAAYSASKFGLRGVSEVLRFDLRRYRIGVSLVCPGAVKTPLMGTVDLVGIDRESPRIKKLVDRFGDHAVSPEKVAEKIVVGIEKNRYMVFTSADIRIGYWFQRKFAPPYELTMRLMNDKLYGVAKRG